MESNSSINNDSISSFISKINNNDNSSEIEKSLLYLINSMNKDEILLLLNNNDFSLYKLFIKKIILSNAKICTLLPDLLNKICEIKNNKNIFLFFNKGCGGCLLMTLFLIVAYNPSLEEKIYKFIIDYLGDLNGCLLEKKSFSACCLKTKNELKEEHKKKKKKKKNGEEKDKIKEEEKEEVEVEFCEKLKEGNWKDYIQAMGVLFSDDRFVEKVKENSKEVNGFVEDFIRRNNAFDKSNAKLLIEELLTKK